MNSYATKKPGRVPESNLSPLKRMMVAGHIRTEDIASKSGLSIAVVRRFVRDKDDVFGSRIESLYKIAASMGCAPVELLPSLGKRSKSGLLYERGVLGRGKG